MDKRTAVVVAASTAIGFVGDVLIYSLAESKGKKFSISIPKGAELYKLLALGFFGGLAIDWTVKRVEQWAMSPQEKKLWDLLETEKQRIAEGQRNNQIPTSIVWAPQIV